MKRREREGVERQGGGRTEEREREGVERQGGQRREREDGGEREEGCIVVRLLGERKRKRGNKEINREGNLPGSTR